MSSHFGTAFSLVTQVAKSSGCDTANIMCTSPNTKRITDSLGGFTVYTEVFWKDVYDEDQKGKLLYPEIEFPSAPCAFRRL